MSDFDSKRWIASSKFSQVVPPACMAALVVLFFSATGLALDFFEVKKFAGFHYSEYARILSFAPELLLLNAFLMLARELKCLSLWRSSIFHFGVPWLILIIWIVLGLPKGADTNSVLYAVYVVAAILVFGTIWAVTGPGWRHEVVASDALEEETPPPSEASNRERGLGCGTVIGLLAIGSMIRRVRRLFRNDISREALTAMGMSVVLTAAFVLPPVFFALAKFRQRRTLGLSAVLSCLLDFLVAGLWAAGVVFWVLLIYRSPETAYSESRYWVSGMMCVQGLICSLSFVVLVLSIKNQDSTESTLAAR